MVDSAGEIAETSETPSFLNDIEYDIERLKKQKRILKTQVSKLYTKLLRLMTDDSCGREDLIESLELYEEKQGETLLNIDELITAYKKAGDDRNAVKTEDELDQFTSETSRDIDTVKSFIAASAIKEAKEKHATARTKESSDQQQIPGSTTEAGLVNSWKDIRRLRSQYETKSVAMNAANRNLERIQIPKFSGDKSKFDSFWAAFSAIVDETKEPPKYKMLRLKACREGKATDVIAKLGYSEEAYEEAKNILKRKFGGHRRQIQSHIEDLRNMSPFEEDNVADIEKFSENLVHTIVILKEHKLWNELQPNSILYLLLIEKIPQSMLSNYFRWLAENRKYETLEELSGCWRKQTFECALSK